MVACEAVEGAVWCVPIELNAGKSCRHPFFRTVPMKSIAVTILTLASITSSAQGPDNDFLDSLGLARLKNYSSARVSSDNRLR